MQHLRNFTRALCTDKCCQQNLCTAKRELDTFVQYWVNRIFTWIYHIYLICCFLLATEMSVLLIQEKFGNFSDLTVFVCLDMCCIYWICVIVLV